MQGKKFIAITAIIFLFGYLIYSVAVSISDHYVKEAESLADTLSRQQQKIESRKQSFNELQQSNDWDFLKPYAERENWQQAFNDAFKELEQAKKINEDQIVPILDRDHEDDVLKLVEAVKNSRQLVLKSNQLSEQPLAKATLLLDSRDNKQSIHSSTQSKANQASNALSSFVSQAADTAKRYPDKANDIAEKQAHLQSLEDKIQENAETVNTEFNASSTDFARFAEAYQTVDTTYEVFDADLSSYITLLAQLDRSYVKVLTDQKVDFFVTVGRANWCEGEYCREGTQMRYPPVKVDSNTFEYFDSLRIEPMARMTRSWGNEKFKLRIPQNRWDALGIKKKYQWNHKYPYAEYWVDRTQAKTYHRYTVIEDGNAVEQAWQPVKNDYFWQNYENLGMAIVTKPLGFYESESIRTAEPVGMAAIAKPTMVNGVPTGSNQYGEWRQDSSGSSFWFYYGMYRILGDFVTPGRYSYNDWNGYYSSGRGSTYYGRNREYGTFGRSTYSHSRYKNSSFSTRNPSAVKAAQTGNTSSVASSIRGAGSAYRGKGPSRSGK